MSSTYSPALGLTLMADGEDSNTWGDVANVVFGLIETALAGYLAIALTTGTTVLTAATGTDTGNQARRAVLKFTGALAGNCIIQIPNVNKIYLIDNSTSNAYTLTVQTLAATTPVLIPQGGVSLIYCDGLNHCYAASGNASTLGGIAAANWARLDASTNATTPGTAPSAVFQNQTSYPFFAQTYAATSVINAADSNNYSMTLTGNVTFNTPTHPLDGQPLTLVLTQDGTGGHTVSFNSSWLFPNANIYIDTAAGGITIFDAVYNAALSKWVTAVAVTGYSNSTATPFSIVIQQNTLNFNLLAQTGTLVGAQAIHLTVAKGVIVGSVSNLTAAMDLNGMPSGSVITLINYGYIEGSGGAGGCGSGAIAQGGHVQAWYGRAGTDGGVAISGPGSGITLNITNGAGYIWGGGGGGGGGGFGSQSSPPAGYMANGGGGGCGAGGNPCFGRAAGMADNFSGGPGACTDGAASAAFHTNPTGSYGAGGAHGEGGSGMLGGSGGNGGDWGAAGVTPGTPAGTFQAAGTAGGAGGYAVKKNTGTVNFTTGGGNPNVKGTVA